MSRKVLWNSLAVCLTTAALVAVFFVAREQLASPKRPDRPTAKRSTGRPASRPHTPSPEIVFRSLGKLGSVRSATAGAKPISILVLDNPAVGEHNNRRGEMLLRELPRQSLLIAGVHELGLSVLDRTVDLSPAASPDGLQVGMAATIEDHLGQLHLVLTDPASPTTPPHAAEVEEAAAQAKAPGSQAEQREQQRAITAAIQAERDAVVAAPGVTLKLEMADDFVQYATSTPLIERAGIDELAPAIVKATGFTPRPVKWDAGLGVPDGVEALLLDPSSHSAFLAANRLHAAIAESGESPQRLVALVRAYANLGDAARCVYNGDSSAFFARAMIYAERAARKSPGDPGAQYARAYALALVGYPMEARAAVERGRALANGAASPAWADYADDLARFRTRKLFDTAAAAGPSQRLASYFTMLTVEHTGLPSIVVNMARLVRQDDPQNLRAIHMVTDNSGVGPRHESTMAALSAQFGLLARLADGEVGAPEDVRKAAAAAVNREFAPDSVVTLFASMDEQKAADGQLLPWSVYASLQRDALFAGAFRRLNFIKTNLGSDAAEELGLLWPMLKDHRYAAVLASFDKPGGPIAGPELFERLDKAHYADLGITAAALANYGDSLAMPKTLARNPNWLGRHSNNMDGTAWDLANVNWKWRDKDAERIQVLSMIKGAMAKKLAVLCPDHPSAVAGQVLNDWANTKKRAAEIEKEFGGHPQVAYALARAYRADHRDADAKRLLEQTIQVAPDVEVFEELAAAIEPAKADGNDAAAMETLMKMLSGAAAAGGGNAPVEDFGLSEPRAADRLARDLIAQGKPEEALPVARRAAGSGAQWALQTLIGNLTMLKQYDEAEALARETQERYPQGLDWYLWCEMTGRGNVEAARADAARIAESLDLSTDDGAQLGAGIFYGMQGKHDRAAKCFEAQLASVHAELLFKLMLAMVEMERNDLPAATKVMSTGTGARTLVGEHRIEIYHTAEVELKACIEDPKRLPDGSDADVKQWILGDRKTQYRANVCYWFGRICELRGDKEQAKTWYREALATSDWTFACRGMAGVAMRRLGENVFKD